MRSRTILRKLAPPGTMSGPPHRLAHRDVDLHAGLLVTRHRAVELVLAGLEIDLKGLGLTRVDQGRLGLLDAVPLDLQVVLDLAGVRDLERVLAGLQLVAARERDRE